MPLELDKEKEAKFEESITERTKLRKQKSNEKESDEQLHTKDIRHLESKESKNTNTKLNTSYITNFFSTTKNRK